jgi:hypothetical protein
LSTAVRAAHDQETPAVSAVSRSLTICGRNCGIANAVAAIGAYSRTSAVIAEKYDPAAVALLRIHALRSHLLQ